MEVPRTCLLRGRESKLTLIRKIVFVPVNRGATGGRRESFESAGGETLLESILGLSRNLEIEAPLRESSHGSFNVQVRTGRSMRATHRAEDQCPYF